MWVVEGALLPANESQKRTTSCNSIDRGQPHPEHNGSRMHDPVVWLPHLTDPRPNVSRETWLAVRCLGPSDDTKARSTVLSSVDSVQRI